MRFFAFTALSLSLVFSLARPGDAAVGAAPTTVEELRAEKTKNLNKRDPRAEDLLKKAQTYCDKLKQSNQSMGARMQKAIDQITFTAGSSGDNRIKADMELLEAIAKDHKEPSEADLAPLQERYKKLCEKFDDAIFNKDFDRAFHIHDKLVRFTSIGLWDKDKISSEMERMEGLVERAPDAAFGKAQLFDSCKNKKLAHVPKLVYVGDSPQEQMYLTNDRPSTILLDEGCGKPVNMELAEHYVQGPDGKLTNFNECNAPALGLPFSPPLSLWAKTRIHEGRLPAVLLKLVDSQTKANVPAYAAAKGEFNTVADVASGKLDEYFKANVKELGPEKSPVLLGLFSDFDREAAATAFGADGTAPFYWLLDPKLKDMPESKRADEVKKRSEKGVYAGPKGTSAELSNKYGDPAIPDGPERVRDSWKKLSKIISESGRDSIAMFCSAGAFHGNKNGAKFEPEAGNQAWNKLEYYWPGENVIDWVGVNAVGSDPTSDPKGANLMEAIEPFMAEARSSSWQATPVMLVDAAPFRKPNPLNESAWITTMFNKIIGGTFPNILAIFVSTPNDLTLWAPEGKSAFRSYVSSNKAFNYPLRFKALTPAATPAATPTPQQ